MTTFTDNVAGITTTTGAADFVISGTDGQHASAIAKLVNGTQYAYKAVYADGSAGYETGVGTWTSGTSTLSRTTVKTSSNSDNKVVWSAGDKLVMIVADSAMLTNWAAGSHTHTLSDVTDSGTAAALDVPAAGDAAAGEVVKGDDTRLTDARTPTSHTHTKADLTDAADFLLESEVDADIKTLSLPASTTISAFGATLVDDLTAAAARTTLDVDQAGTVNYTHPNHTGDVTSSGDGATTIANDAVTNAKLANVATDTIKGRTTAGTGDPEDMTPAQVRTMLNVEDGATADQSAAEIKTAYESNADTNAFTDADHSKLDGIEAGADVTDTANVTAAGALMDSEVDADIKTLSLPANTTISTFGASLVDDASAAAARTTLDVDQAGTDNSTDVTLAGTPDYITIAGQVITRNQIDLTADVAGDLPVAEGGTGASDAAGAKTNLGFMTDVVDDTTPQLGGDLDCQDNDLSSAGGITVDATRSYAGTTAAGDGPVFYRADQTDTITGGDGFGTGAYFRPIVHSTGSFNLTNGTEALGSGNIFLNEASVEMSSNTASFFGAVNLLVDNGSYTLSGNASPSSINNGVTLQGKFYNTGTGTWTLNYQPIWVQPRFADGVSIPHYNGLVLNNIAGPSNGDAASCTRYSGICIQDPDVATAGAGNNNINPTNWAAIRLGQAYSDVFTGKYTILSSQDDPNSWAGGQEYSHHIESGTTLTTDGSHHHIICTNTSTLAITLESASGIAGRELVIKRAGTGSVTVNPDGTETIDGDSTTLTIGKQYECLHIISDGTNWTIVNGGPNIRRRLHYDYDNVSVDNTTTETTVFDGYTFDAGELRTGMVVRATLYGQYDPNAVTSTIQFRVKLGGTTILTGKAQETETDNPGTEWRYFVDLMIRGDQDTKIFAEWQGYSNSTTVMTESIAGDYANDTTINHTSAARELTITAQWGDASSTLDVEAAYLEVM